jgi:hypothetical protein
MSIEIRSRLDAIIMTAEGDTLSECNLRYSDLRGANLPGANLRYADLVGANLSGANLKGADLRGANLTDAKLRYASLCDANLTEADLTDADLLGADFTGADLIGAELRGLQLAHVKLDSESAPVSGPQDLSCRPLDMFVVDTDEDEVTARYSSSPPMSAARLVPHDADTIRSTHSEVPMGLWPERFLCGMTAAAIVASLVCFTPFSVAIGTIILIAVLIGFIRPAILP